MSIAATTEAVKPGDILAEKYRVDQVLGAGGMGVVVAAEHIELRERVAIKFLLDEATESPELAERFLREARAAVKIKSEHVVRVIDVGRLPTGAPYMVMEYLDGEDLSETLQRGALPVEDAVDYLIQSCEAMSVAHRSGIVHRDLKPANLFLTKRPDGSAIVKVLDFGISKVKSADGNNLSLTHTQTMMGSPLYMSPEQMKSSKDVDRRTDIWSLGVILYELLAGRVPFDGSTFPEVLVKVMSEPHPSLTGLRAELPAALVAVVDRCLEKDRDDRYNSVAALAVALTPFASRRTLGLQGRLHSSMSGPAPAPARVDAAAMAAVAAPAVGSPPQPAGLMETRREEEGEAPAAGPEPAAAVAAGTLPSTLEASAEAGLGNATNTAWEGQSNVPAGVPRRRSAGLLWATGAGLAGAGALAVALLSGGVTSSGGAGQALSPAPASSSAAPGVTSASPASGSPSPGESVHPGPEDAPAAAAKSPAVAVAESASVAPSVQPVAAKKPAPPKPKRAVKRVTRSTKRRRRAPRRAAVPRTAKAPTVAPRVVPKKASAKPRTRAPSLSIDFK